MSETSSAYQDASRDHEPSTGSALDWRTIDSAPTNGTRFLAYQREEIFHAYGAVNPKSGEPYFVRRTHERRQAHSYRMMPIEIDGAWAERKVILTEEPDNYKFEWVSWSRDFDFAPTHWAPLPSAPSSATPTVWPWSREDLKSGERTS